MVTLIEWTAILSALAGISATLFVLLQLRHMDKHRDLGISMKLFEWAETERLRKAFKWVETEFQFGDFETYKADIEKNLEPATIPIKLKPSLKR